MDKFVFLLSFFLLLPVSYGLAQSDTVKVVYVDPDKSEDASNVYGISVTGNFRDKYYTLRMVHCLKGEESVKILNDTPCILKDTMLVLNFRANPFSRDSVLFSVSGTDIGAKIRLTDIRHDILMETYSENSYVVTDTIPLIAYSTGFKDKIMWEGKEAERIDFCKVRYAKRHPSEWYKEFNILDYVYFDMIVRCE